MDKPKKNEFSVSKHLITQFEGYREKRYLFCISELDIRNALLFIFARLRAKHLNFLGSKEDLILEAIENSKAKSEERYSLCILTFHHRRYDSPSIVASLLQAIRNSTPKKESIPTIALATDQAAIFAQFGDTAEVREATIRAAAKNGLKGIVVGSLEKEKNQIALIEKIIEVVDADIMARLSPVERKIKSLIYAAYSFLNKMFWSEKEKEENVRKAIDIFQEVLQQSQDNYDALLGQAIASSRSSDPELICNATRLFENVIDAGKDLERTYDGHAGCCYRMAEYATSPEEKKKWLAKGVKTLTSLNAYHEKELEAIRKHQEDYCDPEVSLKLAGSYSRISASLMEIDEKNIEQAIEANLKGIEHDKTVAQNYEVVKLMEKTAKDKEDFLKIAKICSAGRENVPGREIDFLVQEAEAFFKAGKQLESTKIFTSINQYVDKQRLEKWVKYKKGQVILEDAECKQITMFISFLNHRAIHFRQIGNHQNSVNDLKTATSLDPEKSYYDIYFNFAKAILDAQRHGKTFEYTLQDGLEYLITSLRIALRGDRDTYFELLSAAKKDPTLSPHFQSIKTMVREAGLPLTQEA